MNAAFMRTLSRDIRDYERSRKKYSAGSLSSEQFDVAFQKLHVTLGRHEARDVFAKVEETASQSISVEQSMPASVKNDVELLLNFEAKLLAPIFGSKKKTLPLLREAFEAARNPEETETFGIVEKFSAIHIDSKRIIDESRKKSKKEKKRDKSNAKSGVARLTIGLACIITNHFFMPEFAKISGMTGFSSILLAVKALR